MTMTTNEVVGADGAAAIEIDRAVDYLASVRVLALQRVHALSRLLESMRPSQAARALDAMRRSVALIAEVADDELDLDRLAMLRRAVGGR